MKTFLENNIDNLVDTILADYEKGRDIDRMEDVFDQPDKEVIISIINKLVRIVYPGFYRDTTYKIYNVRNQMKLLIEDASYLLNTQIARALKFGPDFQDYSPEQCRFVAEQITMKFFTKVPQIRAYLETDLQASFDGDPAAYYKDEIVLSYPGFFAITVNRIAHELFLMSVPVLPRIMTEYAHSVTGVDIHPGATIGKYFMIDHGTGIVIGETTTIGDNVKIYQGVTLGALSTRGGQKLRSKKRHPTIEDNVTIYAGASILGGDTVIGRNAVIGSNVFITKSIPADTTVSMKSQELQYKSGRRTDVKVGELKREDTWYYVI